MKKLGNVLYITTPEAYLSLDGENVVVKKEEHDLHAAAAAQPGKHRLLQLSGRQSSLMGACAERNIGLCFLTPNGRFLARVTGKVRAIAAAQEAI